MRILEFHADRFSYIPLKKEIKMTEEAKQNELVSFKNVIVLLITVEEKDNDMVINSVVRDLIDYSEKLKCKDIVIYPFAHLSRDLADPKKALNVVKRIEEKLREKFKVHRAPFGWNKKFEISIKGHPLAEQFRQYIEEALLKEEEISKSLKAEEKVKSFWYILDPDGKLIPLESFDFSKYASLKKFVDYEIAKVRAVQVKPPHTMLMRKLEIADYEPGSDPGNMRYYPNGRLIKALLERYVSEKVTEYGASEVETPLMYDYDHPAFKSYLDRFPARHYISLSGKKKYFMRFSACFGQFLLLKDMQLSYRDLPFKLFEMTRYSFRREKSGEIVGLRRLRSFTMPDMHTICKDLKEAKQEFMNQFIFSMNLLQGIGFDKKDYETAIRFTKVFWEENKDFIISLVKIFGRPILIEMWDFRYAYFDPKFEFNFVDALNKASALSTVQIDHENAERYGIFFVDKDGKKKAPKILHCSPSGAIERIIYALLEKAYMDSKKGKVPCLPLWLSPTQVRLIPISEKHISFAEKIAQELDHAKIRVDIDDRDLSLSKRIKNAEEAWVPIIVVIGEKEVEKEKLSVRLRFERKQIIVNSDELIKMIKEKIEGMPFMPLNLPKRLSKRPVFVKLS